MAIERIQLRRGTASQWTDTDPILGAAEIGVELGTPNKFKIGDGSSIWSELDYFSVASASEGIPLSEKGVANGVATLDANGAIPTGQLANIIDSAPETLNTLNELAAALADDADFATTVTQELANKADSNHTHVSSNITDLPDLSGYSTLVTDVSTLQSDVTTAEGNITTLQTNLGTLEQTVNTLDYAPSSHTHDASEITLTFTEITTTTYSLLSADNGKTLVLNPSGGTITFTIDDVFSVGQRADLYLRGTNATFVAGTGQIESVGTSMVTQYTVASIMCVAPGVYALVGSVE